MKTISKYLVFFITLSGLCLLTACNTMEGLGKDVEKVGDEIEEAAN